MAIVKEKFEENGIVSDVIPIAPKAVMNVSETLPYGEQFGSLLAMSL